MSRSPIDRAKAAQNYKSAMERQRCEMPMVGLKLLVRTSDGKERSMKYPVEKVEPFRMSEVPS